MTHSLCGDSFTMLINGFFIDFDEHEVSDLKGVEGKKVRGLRLLADNKALKSIIILPMKMKNSLLQHSSRQHPFSERECSTAVTVTTSSPRCPAACCCCCYTHRYAAVNWSPTNRFPRFDSRFLLF